MRLKGKVAIVTGACGGIGQEIVRKFVSEGARVVAADLDRRQVEDFASQFSGEVKGCGVDVADYAQVEAMVAAAVESFHTLDVVVNNAGIGVPKALLDHDPAADFDLVTRVNQKGVYHGILAGAKKLRELGKPGVILNTSSIYGQMAAELSFTYNVSKAAVDMMTKCAALELAPLGIRVAAVAPGRVDTPMLRQYQALGLWEHIRREQMRNEFTRPEEIADVFAFLASDEANCINGSTVCAEDGFLNFKYPLMAT
ncbi:MAG: SDR family oxidoreductase [Pseudomonadales bacterium]|nr:SDR family oxidoreductase [Pseudomonadales bacterium]